MSSPGKTSRQIFLKILLILLRGRKMVTPLKNSCPGKDSCYGRNRQIRWVLKAVLFDLLRNPAGIPRRRQALQGIGRYSELSEQVEQRQCNLNSIYLRRCSISADLLNFGPSSFWTIL
jgi:hypothetical protein